MGEVSQNGAPRGYRKGIRRVGNCFSRVVHLLVSLNYRQWEELLWKQQCERHRVSKWRRYYYVRLLCGAECTKSLGCVDNLFIISSEPQNNLVTDMVYRAV